MGGRILVVEDDAGTRELIGMNLEHAGFQVALAADVPQAEALVKEVRPDLVVLDWMLPGTPGLTFARRLRTEQRTREVSILMISGRSEEQDKIAALEGGADDYVTKPFSSRELLARVKAVLRRRAPQFGEEVIEIAGLSLDPAARRVSVDEREVDLWTTEFRLLQLLMARAGRVFSRARLLDEIWGDHVFVEERTVDVHIRRLRQALQPTGHDVLIETVRGMGYRFRAESSAYSTVTDLARLRGLSTSLPRVSAA